MITNRQNAPLRPRHRLVVAWQDSAWFPPVLAAKFVTSGRQRGPVFWPVQIITDPTVCASRALPAIEL